MTDRFENLTIGVSRIHKSIQRIKRHKMKSIGLKGAHVMCIYHLNVHPDGLTASDLCDKCKEDKAGISRILADLEQNSFIRYEETDKSSGKTTGKKKYRAKAILTEKGKEQAKSLEKLIVHVTQAVGNGISEQEREIFYRVLFQISDNLNQICEEFRNHPDI